MAAFLSFHMTDTATPLGRLGTRRALSKAREGDLVADDLPQPRCGLRKTSSSGRGTGIALIRNTFTTAYLEGVSRWSFA
jgi:hypothetical protein